MVEILKEGDETLATLYRAILEDLTTVAIEPIPQNIIGDFVGGCVSNRVGFVFPRVRMNTGSWGTWWEVTLFFSLRRVQRI